MKRQKAKKIANIMVAVVMCDRCWVVVEVRTGGRGFDSKFKLGYGENPVAAGWVTSVGRPTF
jgi:hypothetical protein